MSIVNIKIPIKLLPEFLNIYKGEIQLEIINQEEEDEGDDEEEIEIIKKKKVITPEHRQKLIGNIQKARETKFKKHQEEQHSNNTRLSNDELYKDNYWCR